MPTGQDMGAGQLALLLHLLSRPHIHHRKLLQLLLQIPEGYVWQQCDRLLASVHNVLACYDTGFKGGMCSL